ncbi:RICIN domain-containing protein [Streptomyces violascens]|uniref:RICIN domain-containing protein n=1 Tax=Streptomyces violascens TaxID=67381 RepID=UPI0036C1E649
MTTDGRASRQWLRPADGGEFVLVNRRRGKVPDVKDGSTAGGAALIQYRDVASSNRQWYFPRVTGYHRWTLLDQGDGTYKIRNEYSGKLLAIADNSTTVGAFAVQDSDNGTAGNRWRIVRN